MLPIAFNINLDEYVNIIIACIVLQYRDCSLLFIS